MAPSGLVSSFVAAIQASLSVLLVILYGGIAAYLKLLNADNTKAISKICVRMFLPALLITQIGSELHAGSAHRYLVIFIWALICHLISFAIGIVAHLWLEMPDWVTVALMFNNTTSYPLLLIAALDKTGILDSLLVTDETTKTAVGRMKSYFLVFATVSSCLTFAVGPRLIDTEHAPEETKESEHHHENNNNNDESTILENDTNENTSLIRSTTTMSTKFHDPFQQNSFLSSAKRRMSLAQPTPPPPTNRRPSVFPKHKWYQLSPRTKWWLLFISDFFNAPLVGALIGVVIGFVPFLHRSFFNDTTNGGIFTAWLTSSLQNIGGLFVPLPVLVAGVSLYTSMQQQQQQQQSEGRSRTKLPWLTIVFIVIFRFVIWPVASISVIYALVRRTSVLGSDPMLWFAMMLMPTGPPAMKLITLVQVSGASEEEEMSIAKLLTISYVISPILSFTVVGALEASKAAISA